MKSIQIDDAIEQFLLAHAAFIGESPSGILRRVLGIAPPGDAIEVDDDIYQFLLSHAASLGESSISILHRELHLDGAGPGSGPSTVEFHIAAGTAGQPWNTKDTAVVATVGFELANRAMELPSGAATSITAGPQTISFGALGLVLTDEDRRRLGPYKIVRV